MVPGWVVAVAVGPAWLVLLVVSVFVRVIMFCWFVVVRLFFTLAQFARGPQTGWLPSGLEPGRMVGLPFGLLADWWGAAW